MYEIEIGQTALQELGELQKFDASRIFEEIRIQLTYEPLVESRNRKELVGLHPPFEAVPPIWQLRIGTFRVFYDVNKEEKKVYVRAVRQKPPHRTTEEIL